MWLPGHVWQVRVSSEPGFKGIGRLAPMINNFFQAGSSSEKSTAGREGLFLQFLTPSKKRSATRRLPKTTLLNEFADGITCGI